MRVNRSQMVSSYCRSRGAAPYHHLIRTPRAEKTVRILLPLATSDDHHVFRCSAIRMTGSLVW